jgi:hypothetical protein
VAEPPKTTLDDLLAYPTRAAPARIISIIWAIASFWPRSSNPSRNSNQQIDKQQDEIVDLKQLIAAQQKEIDALMARAPQPRLGGPPPRPPAPLEPPPVFSVR